MTIPTFSMGNSARERSAYEELEDQYDELQQLVAEQQAKIAHLENQVKTQNILLRQLLELHERTGELFDGENHSDGFEEAYTGNHMVSSRLSS